jgi:hypothetical protein
MADRADIAGRHGIAHLAHKLVGDTPEQLEADAAAKAALLQAFGLLRPDQPAPEPPIEGFRQGIKGLIEVMRSRARGT